MNLPTTSDLTQLGTAIGVIVVLVMRQIDAYKATKQRTRVNDITEIIADKQVQAHDDIKDVKRLCNGAMQLKLETIANLSKRLADMTKLREDVVIAEAAAQDLLNFKNTQS